MLAPRLECDRHSATTRAEYPNPTTQDKTEKKVLVKTEEEG